MTDRRREPFLLDLFHTLLAAFGPQGWWPADSPFEVIVGAILTQNTAWKNVTRAIHRLKEHDLLDPQKILEAEPDHLRRCVQPAGFFRQKSEYLLEFCRHLQAHYAGDLSLFLSREMDPLRRELLSIRGIGPETADSILLYAAEKPSFVVDAYTRRIFSAHGWVPPTIGYQALRQYFMDALPPDVYLFQEFHALLVRLGHLFCRRNPRCQGCPMDGHPREQSSDMRRSP